MNRRITFVFLVFLAWVCLIVLYLANTMLFSADSLSDRPENYRTVLDEFTVKRGDILSTDGKVLATSKQKSDSNWYDRLYPMGPTFVPVTGFISKKYGRSGIEDARNDDLMSKTPRDKLTGILSQFGGSPREGNDVFLTIDSRVQKTAMAALKYKRGAIVALDPKTGAVLAMASAPTFNPNTVDMGWAKLSSDKSSPLMDRTLSGLYVPGSSFKLIPAVAALKYGIAKPSTRFNDAGRLEIDGTVINNYENEVYGEHDLIEALTFSINSTFAKLGLDLGAGKLIGHAEEYGFNEAIPFDLTVKKSAAPDPGDLSEADVAETAIGQGDLQATPLQMALVVSAIANEGSIQRPYLVKEIRSNGSVIEKSTPSVWKEPMTSDIAEQVTKMMTHVVEEGTGQSAAVHGIVVAGKTGTAEVDKSGKTNAWFVGFAPADEPEVAIAVVIEGGSGSGGQVAAPIARKVMQAALGMPVR